MLLDTIAVAIRNQGVVTAVWRAERKRQQQAEQAQTRCLAVQFVFGVHRAAAPADHEVAEQQQCVGGDQPRRPRTDVAGFGQRCMAGKIQSAANLRPGGGRIGAMRFASAGTTESRAREGVRCCNFRRRKAYAMQHAASAAAPGVSLTISCHQVAGFPDDASADHALVQAFLRRDRAAVEALAERLAVVPRFVACLNRRFGSRLQADEAADVAQDVVEIALRKLASLPVGAPLEAWLYRIAGFELRNALRRKHGRATTELPEGLAAAEAGVAETVERLELLEIAMAQLPPEAAQVVQMHHLDGLTFVEIGARVAATTNVIKGRYYRAIERLTEFLKHRGVAGNQ